MKKHYLILGLVLLIGLPAGLTHANVLKQSLKQATLSEVIQEQIDGLLQVDETQQELLSATDLTVLVQQKCWSARKCKGKVLNNLNAHECKNTGGKSWSDNQGQCYKL